MYDTQDADLLFNQALSEAEAANHQTAAALYAEAGETYLASGDRAMAAMSAGARGAQLYVSGEFVAAAASYQEAAELAEQADEVNIRANALWGRADSLRAIDEWPTVLALCAEAIPLMRQYGYEDHLADMLLLRGGAQYALSQEEDALASADEADALYRESGAIDGQLRSADFSVSVLLRLRRFGLAQRAAGRNVEISRTSSDRSGEAYYRRRLGEALLVGGRPHDAIEEFEESRDLYRDAGFPAHAAVAMIWLARALGALGRGAETGDLLRSAIAVLDAAGPSWSEERDNARLHLGVMLYEAGQFGESAVLDSLLLATCVEESRPLEHRHARVLERLTSALIQTGRAGHAQRFVDELAGSGVLAPGEERAAALTARACSAWAIWHGGDHATANREALTIVADPGLPPETLAEAWVLEIAGTYAQAQDLEGIARLARAGAIYLLLGEYNSLRDVAALVLERTARR